MVEYCTCVHEEMYHEGGGCWGCYDARSANEYKHKFKLDNLKLVEDLAKERKFI